jgi:flagellar basal body rod protein FlgC
MEYVANQALTAINGRLSVIKSNINNIWSSTTADNFDEVYAASLSAIDKIYEQIDTYNQAMTKLQKYNENKAKIKELKELIANEQANPSKAVSSSYTDSQGKVHTVTEYVVDTAKVNAWQAQINALELDNLTLKNEIIDLSVTIIPNNLQPKNNHDIAHRGSKFDGEANDFKIKDNSIEAFVNAGKNGFWGAEADVIQDANGNLVCSHNAVKKGENPISFEEYLDVCKEYGMTAIIDMKYSNGWSKEGEDAYVNQILGAIEEKGMMDSCVIQTNNHHDIVNVRNNSEEAVEKGCAALVVCNIFSCSFYRLSACHVSLQI